MKTITLENGKKVEISDKSYKALEKAAQIKARPDIGEEFWFISAVGIVDAIDWSGIKEDHELWESGNGFFTEEGAVKENSKRKAVQRIKDYITENGMWWKSGSQHIVRFYKEGSLFADWYSESINLGGETFDNLIGAIDTEKNAEKLMKDCEEDLKIIFGID